MAVRVAVRVHLAREEEVARCKVFFNRLLCFLEVRAADELRRLVIEVAALVEKRHHREVFREAEPKVILAVDDRGVHDAGALVSGHEICIGDVPRSLPRLLDRRYLVERLIFQTKELSSRYISHHFVLACPILSDDIVFLDSRFLILDSDHDIVDGLANRQCDVSG